MNCMENWLADRYEAVSAKDFYRYIFPAGSFENKGEYVEGKYNGIFISVTNTHKWDGHRKVKRFTVTDELDAIDIATASSDFCLMSPISYAGKNRTAENARFLYAIAVDVDNLDVRGNYPIGLINLMTRHIPMLHRVPQPTFIVSSGSGLHLYYVLEQPLPLFPDMAKELQAYKRELTRIIWDDTIVRIKSVKEIQQEGIFQGFRMPDTVTKSGSRARAFRTGERVTMDYMNQFVSSFYKAERAAAAKKKGKVTLEYAKKHYPEWYQNRIVDGKPRGTWAVSRNLYEWWKRRILSGAEVGHRYYCIMMLAIYAQKCSYYSEKHNPNPVTREELEADAFSFLDFMEEKTVESNNHFTTGDILDALEAFDERWTTYPRASIEYRTGIPIPAKKYNGRKQSLHLKIARTTLDILNSEADHNLQGRKTKQDEVWAWRVEHPDGTKADCIRDTGLSKPTVYKWW